MPVEIEGAIPFEQDRTHKSYDGAAAQTFWRQFVQADRVFGIFRARYLGKVSPVHFFWGSFDLAVTRFSGRTAPPLTSNNTPHVADWVMNEAYSHECSSIGFWPGNGGYGRAAFYAYAYPEPDGFQCGTGRAAQGAAYNKDVGQFLIDYDAIRAAARRRTTRCSYSFMQSNVRRGRGKQRDVGSVRAWSARRADRPTVATSGPRARPGQGPASRARAIVSSRMAPPAEARSSFRASASRR